MISLFAIVTICLGYAYEPEFRSLVRFVTWKTFFVRRILTEYLLTYGTAKLLAEMYGYYPFNERWFFSNASASRSNEYN